MRTMTWVFTGVIGVAFMAVLASLHTPPKQPTTTWPNMPAGYLMLAEESFNMPIARPWSLIWNQRGLSNIVADSTAPASPPGIMQFRYQQGFAAGEAPGTVVIKLDGARHVFIGLWWKANAEWEGHESNVNKIQFVFPKKNAGDIYMAAYGTPGGPYELRCNLQLRDGDKRDWLRPNRGGGRVIMGAWHRIEWLLEYNTIGSSNGVVRWWLDGQLVGDYRNVVFPLASLDEYKISPTWGGMGGFKSRTDYFWYDHAFVATR